MLWCWRHRQTNSVRVCSPPSRRVAPLRPRGGSSPRAGPGATGNRRNGAPTGLVPMEELQRLLDAAAVANAATTPTVRDGAARDTPVLVTPCRASARRHKV